MQQQSGTYPVTKWAAMLKFSTSGYYDWLKNREERDNKQKEYEAAIMDIFIDSDKTDVIIFDGPRSYALGNINLLIYLRKKLFVNRNGIIRKTFDLTGIPYCLTDELENMTYDELKEPLIYPDIIESSFIPRNREAILKVGKIYCIL